MEHLRNLRILNLVFAGFAGLVALLLLAMWVVPGILALLDGEAVGLVFVLAGLAVGAIVAGVSALHVKAAGKVIASRGRILQTALAVLHVMTFPLGTAFAVYALWICWVNEPTKTSFDVSDGPLA